MEFGFLERFLGATPAQRRKRKVIVDLGDADRKASRIVLLSEHTNVSIVFSLFPWVETTSKSLNRYLSNLNPISYGLDSATSSQCVLVNEVGSWYVHKTGQIEIRPNKTGIASFLGSYEECFETLQRRVDSLVKDDHFRIFQIGYNNGVAESFDNSMDWNLHRATQDEQEQVLEVAESF